MANITEKYTKTNGDTINSALYRFDGDCDEFTPDELLSTHPDPSNAWLTVEKYPPLVSLNAYNESELFTYEGVDDQGLHKWRAIDSLTGSDGKWVIGKVVHAGNQYKITPDYLYMHIAANALSCRFDTVSDIAPINGTSVRYIIGVENEWVIPTSSARRLGYLFHECIHLGDMDLSRWDISNATTMAGMFLDCRSITKLNLTGWDMKNKTDYPVFNFASYPYYNVLSLYYNNSSVHYAMSLECMFAGCTSLKEIVGIEDWDITGSTALGCMFAGCESLKKLDLSKWSLSENTSINHMFYDTGLEELSIAGWDVSKLASPSGATRIMEIIGGKTKETLKYIDVSGFEVSNLPSLIKNNFFVTAGVKVNNVTTVKALGLNDSSISYLSNVFPNAEIIR